MDIKTELRLLDEADVAGFRRMSVAALRNERARGSGPPYQRIGRKVFYPLDALKKYLVASTVTPLPAQSLIHARRR